MSDEALEAQAQQGELNYAAIEGVGNVEEIKNKINTALS